MIKIPATLEGVPAIEETIAAGINVNVTLIFSLDRHDAVIEAYLTGLERLAACGGDLSTIASVASFFVSRVDTETDRRLPEGHPLRGKAAVANAKLAYQLFRERFSGPRWDALAAQGARLQRPLWASTSTKNPAYSAHPLRRRAHRPRHRQHARAGVDRGAAQGRGQPAPEHRDRGRRRGRVQVIRDLAGAGVDFDDVTVTLEREGRRLVRRVVQRRLHDDREAPRRDHGLVGLRTSHG